MEFSKIKLNEYFDVNPIYIRAGEFRKGNDKAPLGWDDEEIKLRNQYLEVAPNSHWLLILDSDEVICGALQNLSHMLNDLYKKNVLAAWIMEMQMGRLDTSTKETLYTFLPRGRLIYKLPKMQYQRYHDRIYYHGRNILEHDERQAIIWCIGTLHYKQPEEVEISYVTPEPPDKM